MKFPTRVIIIALALFTLQGCGLQFWYNRIAWLSTWYADDYVTLTSVQEERIEKLVDKHSYWHRTTQLPRYNQFIDDISEDLRNRNLELTYDNYRDRIFDFYQTILVQVLDDAVNELSQLSDEQVEELMQNINNSAQEQAKEYRKKDDKERAEEELEEAIEYYDEWFDDLTEEQETIITQMVQKTQPTFELRSEYLASWRQAFKLALQERHTESGQKALYSLMLKPRQLTSPELKKARELNSQVFKTHLIQLFNSLSDEQIENFIDFLSDYQADFNDLIEDAD
ncbi:DUF6279 family lipoprotein [Kangiella spongicola]|uniref:Lipoprotein n=1 Tax=Kangiella spongicola TaxID=796379 RepID=A0A318D393_9GAMM|nr:DUF6279 family lipoprotein [Kangiella spongicola]PXF63660.1 hypothetical protein DL796_00470 [Kangiella spongicola]